MPLLDHFHPPLSAYTAWDGFHGQWPAMIVMDLNKRMPWRYRSEPRVHLGATFEIDIGALDEETYLQTRGSDDKSGGGTGTAVWAAPKPTLAVDIELQDEDEYEVKVFDDRQRRLVSAIEIVSPANKDRPESRRTFVAKCAALLHQGVSVSIVDIVTARGGNLYLELLDFLGETDPSFLPDAPSVYAIACRYRRDGELWKLESWAHRLHIGQAFPTLPLWLAADLAVPLELEQTYQETCRVLRIV